MQPNSKILILGASGLLGSAVAATLRQKGFSHLVFANSATCDLVSNEATENYIKTVQPDYIFMLAGLVGGINANRNRQADFLYVNTVMILNVLEGVRKFSPQSKLLYTGSTCVYPKNAPQPLAETSLLSGCFEDTNAGYALAKSTGIVACQFYAQQYNLNCISAMPTNLYGIGDNYDLQNGHFFASLIAKFLRAKRDSAPDITFWGSGSAEREALFSVDCADALIYLMQNYESTELVNIGTATSHSIKEYVAVMQRIIQYGGKILWDTSYPDGMLQKRTCTKKLLSIYPDFKPRSFARGVAEVLGDAQEVGRILAQSAASQAE